MNKKIADRIQLVMIDLYHVKQSIPKTSQYKPVINQVKQIDNRLNQLIKNIEDMDKP